VIKIVGAEFYSDMLNNVINKKWALDEEIADIQSFDIGIMPMPDNEWTKGKCGFKALLYMSCGIPVVASLVGVNSEIIENGISGFLAKDKDGWISNLSLLVEDRSLRKKIGKSGRDKIMKRYSLISSRPLFFRALYDVCGKKGKNA